MIVIDATVSSEEKGILSILTFQKGQKNVRSICSNTKFVCLLDYNATVKSH